MNRNNSSYKDYQKSDSYSNEEYNNEIESYLYANIYYTQNEQDRYVNTKYSNDSIYTPTNYDNFSNKYTANNILAGQSNCNRSKRYPPRFRGISHHLSQEDVPVNIAESNMNTPFRNELYHNNDINRRKQSNDLSPSFNHKHQNNKPHSKKKVKPQHIRFAEEDLQNLSNDLNTTEIQDIQQNCHNDVLHTQEHSSTMLQSVQMVSNNSDISIITQSSDMNVGHPKTKNILKKYEFSKQYIKSLYGQKYKELKKRYQKKKQKSNDQPTIKDSTDENEIHSKYDVLKKSKKKGLGTAEQSEYNDELDVDSDTDESILEVPIPPKPQPPLISLNDSDDDTVLTNKTKKNDNDNDNEKSTSVASSSLCSELDFLNTNEEVLGSSYYENYSRSKNLAEYDSDITLTRAPDVANIVQTEESADDILLNCTRIQKGASKLTQIRRTCKTAQKEQEKNNFEYMADSQTVAEGGNGNNSSVETTTRLVHNTVNGEPIQVLSTENTSNEIHTEDVSQVVPLSQKKQRNKKRCNESPARKEDNKRKKNNDESADVIILDSNITSPRTHNRMDKWERYFFKPMTQEMRMFYNESSGEGSFDIQDVQNKMTRDPRLWGILDEDLMPKPSKRSKGRCNHCHQDGHTRINCPEPRRPPLCYMCGTKGHTETRCPQKMCLTCGKKQSTYRKTCETCRRYHCKRCRSVGHKTTTCPDLWRRYHHTTTGSTVTVPDNPTDVLKPTYLLYCCNCAKQGHDSSTCDTYRWSPHYPTPVHVSNYTCNPQYEQYSDITNAPNSQEEFIPIASCSQYAEQTGKNYKIIYTYGPKKVANGQLRQSVTRRKFCLDGFIEGQVVPHFLEYLLKHVQFNVEFRLQENGNIQIYCRGKKCYLQYISNLISLWLGMPDDEKDRWVISELPFDKIQIMNILNQKFDELQKNLSSEQSPKRLWREIEDLKKDLQKVENDQSQYETSHKKKHQLLNLQTKLFTILRNTSNWSKSCNRLYKIKGELEKKSAITITDYLHILCNYHSTFAPRTPKRIEGLIKCYYIWKSKQLKADKQKENSKTQPHSDGDTISIEEHQPCEPSLLANTQKIESSNELDPMENMQSNVDSEKTFGEPCTINNQKCNLSQIPLYNAPSEDFSNDINIDINDTTTATIHDTAAELHIPSKTSGNQIYTNALENSSLNIEPKCAKVELDFATTVPNYSTDTSITENTTVSENCKPEVGSLDIPPTEETLTDKLSIEANNEDKQTIDEGNVNVPEEGQTSTEIQDNMNIENRSMENSNVSAETKIVNNMQCYTTAVKNESPNMIIKEEQDVCIIESNVPGPSKELTKLTEDIIERANCVINAALDFQLPYMNKAVTEVQKRLNENILEHKHIDVLQKLIDLEKLHQEHVNTFSKFLE